MPEARKHVFVSGFARSGTTLLCNLLNAQPRFTVWSELMPAPLGTAQNVGGLKKALSRTERNRALAWHKLSLHGTPLTTRIGPDDFHTVGDFYRLAIDELGRDGDLVVGHKLAGYGPHTPVFEHILGETDVLCIFALRDVRDVVLSQANLVLGAAIDPDSWRIAARRLRELQGHPRLAVVRYEDLVRDPARALEPVERLLGIPLVTDLRELARNGKPWRDNSSFHDVEKLFDRRPVERWREHTHDPVVRFAAWWCADELERWGHAPFPESFSWRERARFARATAVRRALHAARPLGEAVRRLRNP